MPGHMSIPNGKPDVMYLLSRIVSFPIFCIPRAPPGVFYVFHWSSGRVSCRSRRPVQAASCLAPVFLLKVTTFLPFTCQSYFTNWRRFLEH